MYHLAYDREKGYYSILTPIYEPTEEHPNPPLGYYLKHFTESKTQAQYILRLLTEDLDREGNSKESREAVMTMTSERL